MNTQVRECLNFKGPKVHTIKDVKREYMHCQCNVLNLILYQPSNISTVFIMHLPPH